MNILKRGNKYEVVKVTNKSQLYTLGFIGRNIGNVDFADIEIPANFMDCVDTIYIDFDWYYVSGEAKRITYSSRPTPDDVVVDFKDYIKSLYNDGLNNEEDAQFDSLTIVMGKTFSGKTNYVESAIKKGGQDRVKTHTTRPKRPTETGDEYYFEEDVDTDKSIALRTYKTAQGDWSYWTSLEDFKNKKNPILILDLEGTTELLYHLIEKYGDSIIDKISILYMNTPIETIIKRAHDSDRGKSEDSSETFRRLSDDIREFEELDNSVKSMPLGEIEVSYEVLNMMGSLK